MSPKINCGGAVNCTTETFCHFCHAKAKIGLFNFSFVREIFHEKPKVLLSDTKSWQLLSFVHRKSFINFLFFVLY